MAIQLLKRPKAFSRFVLMTVLVSTNLRADPIQDARRGLASPDASVRSAAMRNLAIKLGTVSGEPYLLQSEPVFMKGLEDPDPEVRKYAISGLRGFAMLTSPLVYGSRLPANTPNLTTDPANQTILLTATSDPDPFIREMALEIYAITYRLTPDLEDKVIQEFNSPDSEQPHQESMRPELMETLLMSGAPSPHAVAFLAKLLNDPKWAPLVAQSMAVDKSALPTSILDKLAGLFSAAKNPVERAAYARAMGSFGTRSRPYLPLLQKSLAVEPDQVTKGNIEFAIKKISR